MDKQSVEAAAHPTELGQADRQQRLARRTAALYADDQQFRQSRPAPEVSAALGVEGITIQQVVQTAMEGYADRPALGQRSYDLVTSPADGRDHLQLLPHFTTITYRQLWDRVAHVAGEWVHHHQYPLAAGNFVAIMGFASTEYTIVDIACIYTGAVSVPLPAGAPVPQHCAIIDQTSPTILAVSIEYLQDAVEALLAGATVPRLIVFDYEPGDADQHDTFVEARQRLAESGCPTVVDVFTAVLDRGRSAPDTPIHVGKYAEDPLVTLIYTSGSTGTPKGVMYTDRMVRSMWLRPAVDPAIGLTYMPMSHQYARGWVARILAHGGIGYFAGSSDMSTLFDDFALVRPTSLNLVPRVCDLIYQQYVAERDAKITAGENPATADELVMYRLRNDVLGGRVLSAICGSAPLAREMHDFIEACLDVHVMVGYGSTEMMGVTNDFTVTRPDVIDYKLVDVPELGYFNTDRPHPRGELLVKTRTMMPGYYRRPDVTAEVFDDDGFYRTGDIMAQTGPDRLIYVDRRNNVIKLAQGEFVAIAKLEAVFSTSPLVQQIYVYGSSARSFLLAVVVPVADAVADDGQERRPVIKSAIIASLQDIGKKARLNGYEIPREILIEPEPFTLQNNLLTPGGKLARPQLRERYGESLEALYTRIATEQVDEVRALRAEAASLPTTETVLRAVAATLGVPADEVDPTAGFGDLGGDSLSALSLSRLLRNVLDVEVPVGVLLGATSNLAAIVDYITRHRDSDTGPTSARVHRADETRLHAADLTLPKFIDAATLDRARQLPPPTGAIRTVLLTGSTGFLGRFLALTWLRRLAGSSGRLICVVRGEDAVQAGKRLEDAVGTDPALLREFQELASGHLEVVAGDIGETGLGIDQATWQRLADEVDLIVHPAAHVNHMLPYDQLFAANVASTAELIRLAMTSKIKAMNYISSMGVASGYTEPIGEQGDIRTMNATRALDQSYANAYSATKWASEVLTREAHDWCAMPVAVFRPDMILAHRRYSGQLNVPDMFTRLLISLVATGIAPGSFYQPGVDARPHYDGLPVDYVAEAIMRIGAAMTAGHHTFNVVNPHDDRISLDQFVDWLIEAGQSIDRIADHAEWVSRFETALTALPDRARQHSVLMVLDAFRRPIEVVSGSAVPSDQFRRRAAEELGYDIPQLSKELIEKYVADLRGLKLA